MRHTLSILVVIMLGHSLGAQQSLYLPFKADNNRYITVTQSLSRPSEGNPHQTLQKSFINGMSEINPEYFQYIDTIAKYRNGSFDYLPQINSFYGDHLEGFIIDFNTERYGDSYLTKVAYVHPVVRYNRVHRKQEVVDTLDRITINGECQDAEYSFLVRSTHHFGDSTIETKYLKNVFEGKEDVELFDEYFEAINYSGFVENLTTIDTSVIACSNRAFGESIVIDTFTYEWENLKAVYQSTIDFCIEPMNISIHHEYIGLARIAIDRDTGEFKYDWPITYFRNKNPKNDK